MPPLCHAFADISSDHGIDTQQLLDQAIDAAKTFKPLSADSVESLLPRTKEAAADGKFELFKTSQHSDSTAEHPEWLGGESPHVQQLSSPS